MGGEQALPLRGVLRRGLGELQEALVAAHDDADPRDGRRPRDPVRLRAQRVGDAQELAREGLVVPRRVGSLREVLLQELRGQPVLVRGPERVHKPFQLVEPAPVPRVALRHLPPRLEEHKHEVPRHPQAAIEGLVVHHLDDHAALRRLRLVPVGAVRVPPGVRVQAVRRYVHRRQGVNRRDGQEGHPAVRWYGPEGDLKRRLHVLVAVGGKQQKREAAHVRMRMQVAVAPAATVRRAIKVPTGDFPEPWLLDLWSVGGGRDRKRQFGSPSDRVKLTLPHLTSMALITAAPPPEDERSAFLPLRPAALFPGPPPPSSSRAPLFRPVLRSPSLIS